MESNELKTLVAEIAEANSNFMNREVRAKELENQVRTYDDSLNKLRSQLHEQSLLVKTSKDRVNELLDQLLSKLRPKSTDVSLDDSEEPVREENSQYSSRVA